MNPFTRRQLDHLAGVDVIPTPMLPMEPSDGEDARREVRHGMRDVLDWLGVDVGPAPGAPTHALQRGRLVFVSEDVHRALREKSASQVVWDERVELANRPILEQDLLDDTPMREVLGRYVEEYHEALEKMAAASLATGQGVRVDRDEPIAGWRMELDEKVPMGEMHVYSHYADYRYAPVLPDSHVVIKGIS